MPSKASAKRYAQAVFSLASESDQLDQWAEYLRTIAEALENEELLNFLQHAKIPLHRKVQTIEQAFPQLAPVARNLLCVLVSRGLVELVPEVESAFQRLLLEARGIEEVEVITAVPMTDPQRERTMRLLKELRSKEVLLDSQVDSSILGGLVIRVGDKLIDGSTRTRLRSLGKQLQTDSAAAGL